MPTTSGTSSAAAPGRQAVSRNSPVCSRRLSFRIHKASIFGPAFSRRSAACTSFGSGLADTGTGTSSICSLAASALWRAMKSRNTGRWMTPTRRTGVLTMSRSRTNAVTPGTSYATPVLFGTCGCSSSRKDDIVTTAGTGGPAAWPAARAAWYAR